MKIVNANDPEAKNAINISEVNYDKNGKRIVTTADLYFITYLTVLWILDYMKFYYKQTISKFNKSVFPINMRKDVITQKKFIESEIILKNYISTINAGDKFYSTQFEFNDVIDNRMNHIFDSVFSVIHKKLIKANYNQSFMIASLISLDVVYNILIYYIKYMEQKYGNQIPEFRHLRILIPKLDCELESVKRGKHKSSRFIKLSNIYVQTFNSDKQEVDLNSKKLGIHNIVDRAADCLYDIDFMCKAWDACDNDYLKHGENNNENNND